MWKGSSFSGPGGCVGSGSKGASDTGEAVAVSRCEALRKPLWKSHERSAWNAPKLSASLTVLAEQYLL